jgi:acetyl/propionyl-CoA carboxylase alpha subunit
LSENADFADDVRQAGIIFIGPSAKAMSTLGDKRTAKDYLRRNEPDVPLIPGFSGSSQDADELQAVAQEIGFPVMLKASAGGGGKGMRIVREASQLQEELTRARSEAARSFGSEDCILEKYIESGKHIEIQIVGDSYGNVVSLWERECSIQRRHQKVIEETPSPWMTPEKRREMSEVAKKIGRLLEYENAGTVEFVVDVTDGSFYFLEVNTRLQVEHPITEEVTGIDIVALQLFVAAGGRLDTLSVLDNVPQNGCAIECRLCAEDPYNDFFPEHGVVRLWQPASEGTSNLQNTRFETAIETGSRVSIHFDPMIAKIVVWAPTRAMAIQRMVKTLSHTVCAGVKTNQLFLQSCLLHEAFQNPAYTTAFIPDNLPALLKSPYETFASDMKEVMGVIPALFLRNVAQYLPRKNSTKPFQKVRRGFRNQRFDPVGLQTDVVVADHSKSGQDALICGWQYSPQGPDNRISVTSRSLHLSELSQNEDTKSPASQVTFQYNEISNMIRGGQLMQANSHSLIMDSCHATIVEEYSSNPWIHAALSVSVNGKVLRIHVATEDYNSTNTCITPMGKGRRIFCHYPLLGTFEEYHCYNLLSFCESIRESVARESGALSKQAVAPMPCKVLSVLKKDGDVVKPGETVMIIESMKMEMAISLPQGGKFEAYVQKGDSTNEGTVLCRVT